MLQPIRAMATWRKRQEKNRNGKKNYLYNSSEKFVRLHSIKEAEGTLQKQLPTLTTPMT